MPQAVLYARYSSDMQRDASIEDQIRLCQERAKRDGYRVDQTYTDHAVSGASMMRPGIQMLMQDAAAGKFDVVYAEALDRISRDQEDIAAIFKRLSFAGAKIITLSEGEISHLHIGLKGTMNALFLKDLADKTRRGLRGRVEQGKSPKAIAIALNKENVPGPTGRGWSQSTINGNRQRGTGILNNEHYIGRLIWNRVSYPKNPDTGKRISKLNPEKDWIIQDVPDLRIVDQPLWDKVRARQANLTKTSELWQTNRPRNLFAYLIKCGVCGGGCSTVSTGRIGCSAMRNKGTCTNRRTIKRDVLEEAILGSLRKHLMDEELCKIFCEEYTAHMNKITQHLNAALHSYRAELEKLERERKKLVQSILNGVPGDVLKDEAHRINNRKIELERILSNAKEQPVLFPSKYGGTLSE